MKCQILGKEVTAPNGKRHIISQIQQRVQGSPAGRRFRTSFGQTVLI